MGHPREETTGVLIRRRHWISSKIRVWKKVRLFFDGSHSSVVSVGARDDYTLPYPCAADFRRSALSEPSHGGPLSRPVFKSLRLGLRSGRPSISPTAYPHHNRYRGFGDPETTSSNVSISTSVDSDSDGPVASRRHTVTFAPGRNGSGQKWLVLSLE